MNVLIVDDDKIVSRSLATILSVQPDIEIAGCGSDGDEAVSLFDELAPDVLLMDIQMQGRDGLSAAEKILASHPDAAIVFLTTFADDEYIVRALKMGARGYLIDGEATNIDYVGTEQSANRLYIDLQGRRVAQPTQPGIYFQDGRKVVIK